MALSATTLSRIRERLREKSPPGKLSGRAYFTLLSGGLILAIALCIYMTQDVMAAESLTVPVTFLYANLVEYWAHRIPMHRPVPLITLIFRGHTLQHHLFFTHEAMECENKTDFRFLVLPPYMMLAFMLALVVPAAGVLFFLASVNVGLLFAATALAYYLNYEAMHALYHLPESNWLMRIAWLRALRGSHRCHHDHRFMAVCNFNITFPIGDLLFGTRHSQSCDEAASQRIEGERS